MIATTRSMKLATSKHPSPERATDGDSCPTTQDVTSSTTSHRQRHLCLSTMSETLNLELAPFIQASRYVVERFRSLRWRGRENQQRWSRGRRYLAPGAGDVYAGGMMRNRHQELGGGPVLEGN